MNIKTISSALPNWIVDNATIEHWSGLPQTMLTNKIGVEHRHFMTSDESGTDLSERAIENLIKIEPNFDLSRIGLLIVVTQNPDYRLPHNSALLQSRLGLSQDTACFDISLGCSGFVYALSVAKGFMVAEDINEALIVTCDPYSKCIDKTNRDVIGLFGDAASVTWLCPDGEGALGRGDFGTDGNGAHNLIIRGGGAAHPLANLDGNSISELSDADYSLHMNGRAIFNFMMTRVEKTVDKCLKRNNLTRNDIDLFVFHQASQFLLETLRKRMGLSPERVPILLSETGNTVSSSIPLVLETLMHSGKCREATVLISGFGVGLSWASNIIRFGGSND